MTQAVFVLGAGASYEYGLPTGADLIEEITTLCGELDKISRTGSQREDSFRGVLIRALNMKTSDQQFKDLRNDDLNKLAGLSRSLWLAKSIDNYINDQEDATIAYLGKFAITACILRAERTGRKFLKEGESRHTLASLFPKTRDKPHRLDFGSIRDTWLIDFFRELRGQVQRSKLGQRLASVSIINFNYDRCIEQFLFNAFKEYDNLSDRDAAELVNSINIIHPYGTVGRLPWQNASDDTGQPVKIDYGYIDGGEAITIAAEGIQTFTQSQDSKIIEHVQSLVNNSSCIAFLGFGFHKQNMKLLGIDTVRVPQNSEARNVYATTHGMSDRRTELVLQDLGVFSIGTAPSPLNSAKGPRVNTSSGTCTDFFFEFGEDVFNNLV
ncbi:hypothetical protein A9Q96_14925 [Rhodobacterales bacterium 52_120_T64]|nr:hypothetical protein A9Q96_14925 [Rhodobacterales bacterium 52_120_T64]